LEFYFVSRAELPDAGNIRRNDVGNLGITAGGLLVNKEYDRLAVGRNLNGTKRNSFREKFAMTRGRSRLTRKPQS
jgi:hypothetical protein